MNELSLIVPFIFLKFSADALLFKLLVKVHLAMLTCLADVIEISPHPMNVNCSIVTLLAFTNWSPPEWLQHIRVCLTLSDICISRTFVIDSNEDKLWSSGSRVSRISAVSFVRI